MVKEFQVHRLRLMSARIFLFICAISVALAVSAPAAPSFSLESTVLYQPDEPLRERLGSADELATHITQLVDVSTTFFASAKKPERLDIVVGLRPEKKVKVWFVSSRRSSRDKELLALRKKLEAVPPCAVRGAVAFALRCPIAGGGPTKAKGKIPMPEEWHAAGPNVLIPDGIFERIWRD